MDEVEAAVRLMDAGAAGVLDVTVTPVSAAAWLRERAESYESDARTFRDSITLGVPIGGAGHAMQMAVLFRMVAEELRKCAAEVPDASAPPF